MVATTLVGVGPEKKYKRCHLGREQQEPLSPWDAQKDLKKAFNSKTCMAPASLKGACEGSIISAHTVPRGSSLSKISKSGHVLGYKLDFASLNKNAGKIKFTKIGVRQASTFNGFCAKHDRELFSCVENEDFVARQDQCFTVCFRAIARELYAKRASTSVDGIMQNADKGRSVKTQLELTEFRQQFNLGTNAAVAELEATFSTVCSAMTAGNYGVVCNYVIELSDCMPIMFAGGFSPRADVHGTKLQDLADLSLSAQQIFLSCFGTASGSAIVLSWLGSSDAIGKKIADQLSAMPIEDQVNWIIETVFLKMENLFIDPNWYSKRTKEQLDRIDRLVHSGINPFDFLDNLIEPLPNPQNSYDFPENGKTSFV